LYLFAGYAAKLYGDSAMGIPADSLRETEKFYVTLWLRPPPLSRRPLSSRIDGGAD
jgi:hypothetical protein